MRPDGSALEYCTFLGGLGNDPSSPLSATDDDDIGWAVAVDAQGNAVVAGRTESERFTTLNPVQPTFGGGPSDAFVAKLNPTGTALLYSTYFGGGGEENRFGAGVAVDPQGNAYTIGSTNSGAPSPAPATVPFPTAPGALQPVYSGQPETEAFAVKLTQGGAFAYSTYAGTGGLRRGYGVAADSDGNAYLTGSNTLRKLGPDGSAVLYNVTLGGEGRSVNLDPAGNVYVTGITNGPGSCSSSGFYPTASAYKRAYNGGTNDAFVTKVGAAASPTFPVNINTGAFTGRYIIHGVGQLQGSVLLNLAPGTYSFDAFGNIGGSSFNFTVTATGQLTGLTNNTAAQICGNTLQLRTTTINVDPQNDAAQYLVSTHDFGTGYRTFTVVPGLTYILESGALVGGSTIQFHVGAGGVISQISNPASATASGNTLTLNNTNVVVNPGGYAGGYSINRLPYADGTQTFVLIPGLRYVLEGGAAVGGSAFTFTLGNDGSIVNVQVPEAATASGNTLSLNNVVVYVDPTTYTGAYQVLGYANLSGQRSVTLIPGLVAFAGTAGGGAYFTPTAGAVTPSSGVVTVNGQNHTFHFSLTPPSTVSIGGFTFSINAPPDEAVVLSNPVSAINATAFPCSGVDLSALPTIQQKVNRVLTDANTGTQVLGQAQFEARYLGRTVTNEPGPDFVVFELGSGAGNEPFALSIYDPARGVYTPYVTYQTTPTSYFTCSNLRINYAQVDLSDLGFAPGARVSRLRFDNLHVPNVNSSGADISDIMALHLGPPLPAGPFQINFNPGGYTGAYSVEGAGGQRPASLTLNPGTYVVDTNSGNDGKFFFDVNALGQVTNVSKPAAAHGEGNTLVLHNTDLVVEPQAYTGSYTPTTHFNITSFRERRTVVMIPGLSYALSVGDLHTAFRFTIEADGQVTNISQPEAAHAEANVVVLHNAPLTVEPQAFTGTYFPTTHLNIQGFRGRQSVVLVPGLRYPLNIGDLHCSFLFTLGANGQVSDISNPAAAYASGDTLVLNNAELIVEPRAYAGPYTPNTHFGFQTFAGRQSIVLVPNIEYYLSVGNKFSLFTFKLGPDGAVESVGNAAAATALGHTLTLNNSCLRISPGGYPDNYRLRDLTVLRGEQTVILVPGLQYVFTDANLQQAQLFNLDAAGHPAPSSLALAYGGTSYGFTFAAVACDQEPPVTTAQLSPSANPAGWNNSDVTVSLQAADNIGGSGVRRISYSATGAQSLPQTTVNGDTAGLTVTAEGVTTITFFAEDNAGNVEQAQTITVRIDKTAPSVNCGSADGLWHAADVSIPCTTDGGVSGLASASNASFTLTTNVPVNTETANAATDSRQVCDLAGNCATAGPVSGNKVDKKAPDIQITSPTGTGYLLNQAAVASYDCADGGSGVAACGGPVASGNALDTASVGQKTFTVNATDQAGNTASRTVVYSVGYNVCALYDQTKAHRSGSTIPVKLQLCDAAGVNYSAPSLTVTALRTVMLSTYAPGEVEDAGHANPDDNFRYDAALGGTGGYIFNLKTTGLTTGTYVLVFAAGGDPLTRVVQFQIK